MLDETLSLPDTERVLPRAGELDEALATLNANRDVVYAEPDLAVLPASTDPRFAQQWGLENTGQTIAARPGPWTPTSTRPRPGSRRRAPVRPSPSSTPASS